MSTDLDRLAALQSRAEHMAWVNETTDWYKGFRGLMRMLLGHRTPPSPSARG